MQKPAVVTGKSAPRLVVNSCAVTPQFFDAVLYSFGRGLAKQDVFTKMTIAAKVNALLCLEQVSPRKSQAKLFAQKQLYRVRAPVQIFFAVGKQNEVVAKALVILAF